MTKASLADEGNGLVAQKHGWFVVNAADAEWMKHPRFGAACTFEGRERFPEIGINLRVLQPGQPNCLYHRETEQEGFLVLEGECRAIVEGTEVPLERWDFFHCPPGTNHVFVGAGDGPCLILMVGARKEGAKVVYPFDPTAAGYGGSVEKECNSAREAYAGFGPVEKVRGREVLEGFPGRG